MGGDDIVRGGSGSDTYLFGWGDGNDVIEDWADSGSTDVLELGDLIVPESVYIDRGTEDFWDIFLDFGGGNSVTIKGGFIGGGTVIEEVRFDDSTMWTVDDIRQLYLDQISTEGDDAISGFIDVSDLIHAKAGNDTIYGYSGNDAIYGEEGDDIIFGNDGDDTIIGGQGNDYLVGGAGSDTFVFNATDGQDWIDDLEVGIDKIDLRGVTNLTNFADVLANASEWVSGTTWLYADANNYLRLEGVSIANLQAGDFIFA
ncbi:hypothetical protein ACO34A_28670 (plasmid) [Rhizobium sp. ACO-34A]|nr:hypothetical protein ACO34A_28670 [Rhizobium sp. ACO-34A]